jgi:hypothetical protein
MLAAYEASHRPIIYLDESGFKGQINLQEELYSGLADNKGSCIYHSFPKRLRRVFHVPSLPQNRIHSENARCDKN